MEIASSPPPPQQSSPRVALLPTPGMGHLIPAVELAKLLVARHGFSVTIINLGMFESQARSALLSSLPAAISSLVLPPVSLDDLPPKTAIETTICVGIARSLPALRDALSDLAASTDIVAFVCDLFATDGFDVARELGLPLYLFFPSNLHTLSLVLHLPEIDASTTCEYRDLPEPLRLPGCVPIPGPDLHQPLQDRSSDAYRWVLHTARRYREAEGFLVNSFEAIEPGAAKVLSEPDPGRPPVYLVGPLTQKAKAGEEAECLRWLDGQPSGSVIFVSFGSGGTLTTAQMAELALGLEMSGQRFLWVVRSPSDAGDASETYFSHQSKGDAFGFLPAGFVNRTREVGLLLPSWAPQVAVLNHKATGGFLSHCGWNSTLESAVAGVPMVAWPLFAEQRQNAVVLVDGTRIALRAQGAAEGQLVTREEVARVVSELMAGEEGKAARRRVAEIQKAGVSGLQEGGAAYRALDEVTRKWKSATD